MRTKILNLIEEDCKLTAKDIAAMIGEDEAAVAAELAAMERNMSSAAILLLLTGIRLIMSL